MPASVDKINSKPPNPSLGARPLKLNLSHNLESRSDGDMGVFQVRSSENSSISSLSYCHIAQGSFKVLMLRKRQTCSCNAEPGTNGACRQSSFIPSGFL